MASERFTFNGWSLWKFLKGRKRLLITLIGGIATFITTENPLLAGIVATGSEFLFALIEYFLKE